MGAAVVVSPFLLILTSDRVVTVTMLQLPSTSRMLWSVSTYGSYLAVVGLSMGQSSVYFHLIP